MMLSNIFIALATVALLLQLGVLTYCVKTNNSPIDVCYGYSIWGVIPVILLGELAGRFAV